MKTFCLFLLFNIFTCQLFSTPCDSLVIQVSNSFSSSGVFNNPVIFVSTYRNGLLIHDNNNSYSYDSLGRLTEVLSSSMKKTVYLYNVSGQDSVIISYGYDGQAFYLQTGQFFINDINGNRMFNYYLDYDTTSMQWDTSFYTNYLYSIDSLTQSDSVYIYPSNYLIHYDSSIKDSLGRIISGVNHSDMSWGHFGYTYDSICIYRVSQSLNNFLTVGPFGSSSSVRTYWVYDSHCRPAYNVDTSFTNATQYIPAYYTVHRTDFFYADCNNIAIVGRDTAATCLNQPYSMDINIYGGTGPYVYNWSGDSLSSYNILNPLAYTDSGNTFYLTVTDSIGNISQFQETVIVNYFTTSVTNASCYSCNNGSVVLNYNGIEAGYIHTVTPDSGTWNGNTLSGLNAGEYLVCSNYYPCSYCDSVHIYSPILVEEAGQKNPVKIFPNPGADNLFVIVDVNYFESGVDWHLYDMQGRLIKAGYELQNEFGISLAGTAKGMYYFEITSEIKYEMKVVIE